MPRLGAAVGPCPADLRDRGLSEPPGIARALAALRGQVPERVYNTEAVAKWRARFGGASLL